MTELLTTASEAPSRAMLLGNRNLRWLLGGGLLSMLGDQFTLLALPWLVLQLSRDPLVLGTVLALSSLPRAVFILVGGAIVDRYSPKQVLWLSKCVNAALLALLAALVALGSVQLWMVYGLAMALGLSTAFSFPAGSAILPRTLPAALLQPANGLMMGIRQLCFLLGPLLAGLLVAGFAEPPVRGSPAGTASFTGLALAFAFDALSFVVSAWTLSHVQPSPLAQPPATTGVLPAVLEALRWCWRDAQLRSLFGYFAAVAFFVGGPIQVALPLMAQGQLPGGAAALGFLLASHGVGSLLGMAWISIRPGWRLRRSLGASILSIDAMAGLLFLPLGHIHAVWQGMVLLLVLGGLGGLVQVAVFSWMQQRVPPQMLGRTMSLFMFIFMGLAPLASAAAGVALSWLSPADLFTVCGLALMAIVLYGTVFTPMRGISFPARAEEARPRA